jgi:hypothetical protein
MFTGGAYQVSVAQPRILHECGPDPTFSNFVYQVQITITRGDFGGIAFRIDNTFTKYYYFRISQDGSYELVLNTGSHRQVLQDGSGSSIHTGLGQQNTLAVVANGNTITLYVNNQQVTSVNDSTYSQGRIGVIAGDGGNPTEVEFRDAKVWTL